MRPYRVNGNLKESLDTISTVSMNALVYIYNPQYFSDKVGISDPISPLSILMESEIAFVFLDVRFLNSTFLQQGIL